MDTRDLIASVDGFWLVQVGSMSTNVTLGVESGQAQARQRVPLRFGSEVGDPKNRKQYNEKTVMPHLN